MISRGGDRSELGESPIQVSSDKRADGEYETNRPMVELAARVDRAKAVLQGLPLGSLRQEGLGNGPARDLHTKSEI